MSWLFIIALVLLIFFGTFFINPKNKKDKNEDTWVKVKLKLNHDVVAGWCRVMPERGIKFYTIDGDLIDQKRNHVMVVEPCITSGPPPHLR